MDAGLLQRLSSLFLDRRSVRLKMLVGRFPHQLNSLTFASHLLLQRKQRLPFPARRHALALLDVPVNDLVKLDRAVLIYVFVHAHIAAADLNNQLIVLHVCAELLLAKFVLRLAEADDWNLRELSRIQRMSEQLINLISLDRRVLSEHELVGKNLAVRLPLLVQFLEQSLKNLILLAEVLDTGTIFATDFEKVG